MPSRHSMGTCQENELARNSSGNIRPQSSRLAEPQWTDSGVKNGTSVRELISTHTHTKVQAGNEWSNISQEFSRAKKKPPPPPSPNFYPSAQLSNSNSLRLSTNEGK